MIDVYPIALDAPEIDEQQGWSWLSMAEQARANRFIREQDKQSYVMSHAMLRHTLAQYLACDPGAVVIEIDKYGKPYLPDSKNLYFNLSHSKQRALVAVSQNHEVGVDVEYKSQKPDLLAIAERFFTYEEYIYIKYHQDQVLAFYQIWTAKEAYVKAQGQGLAYGLSKFCVVDSDDKIKSWVDSWQLHMFTLGDDYMAAVVGMGEILIKKEFNYESIK